MRNGLPIYLVAMPETYGYEPNRKRASVSAAAVPAAVAAATGRDGIIIFAHTGDLHLTAPAADNARDVRAVVDEIAAVDDLDFNRDGRRW